MQHRLRQQFGRDGTIAELGQASGLTTQQILTLRNRTGQPRSIDAPVWADLGSGLENVPFGDTIADVAALDPCDAAGRTLLLERLACHLSLLPDREASVLSMRYGLGGDIPKPRREIGAHFGVSYDRVRQIELRALARLRSPLASGRVPGARVSASAETAERGGGRIAAASVSRSA
ncbi:sigma factor-like helix-turn-helix DNA-binding protein [Cryobacterium sandaracinum]|uniref:sigma factor-like helix-turn-helix DNA-binding protein n=1 Tax=Cryobacterium sandaracinum TaxID=1259247 RepID=UPI00141BBBBB|nr:sigma factor-like helix-turn-helix DNA-binding protein [Cryobacterium sandaracinum]